MDAGRRDYPRPARRPFSEKGCGRPSSARCDPVRRWPAALPRLDLPQTPPLPHSTPALIPQVTHRFPGRGAYSKALRLLRWVAERQLVDVDALGVDPHSQNSIASVRDVSAAVGCACTIAVMSGRVR